MSQPLTATLCILLSLTLIVGNVALAYRLAARKGKVSLLGFLNYMLPLVVVQLLFTSGVMNLVGLVVDIHSIPDWLIIPMYVYGWFLIWSVMGMLPLWVILRVNIYRKKKQ